MLSIIDERGPGHIFISYAREDGDFAQRLAKELGDVEYEIWIDVNSIRTGPWPEQIKEAIFGCYVFIVVLSPDSKASKWVQKELHYADKVKDVSQIIPIILEEVDLPLQVQDISYVDFRGGFKTVSFNKLLESFPELPHLGRDVKSMLLSPRANRRLDAVVEVLASFRRSNDNPVHQTYFENLLSRQRDFDDDCVRAVVQTFFDMQKAERLAGQRGRNLEAVEEKLNLTEGFLREKVAELAKKKKRLEGIEKTLDITKQSLQEAASSLDATRKTLGIIQQELKEAQKKLAETEQKLSETEQELEEAYQILENTGQKLDATRWYLCRIYVGLMLLFGVWSIVGIISIISDIFSR